jgi:hypothetical protein
MKTTNQTASKQTNRRKVFEAKDGIGRPKKLRIKPLEDREAAEK